MEDGEARAFDLQGSYGNGEEEYLGEEPIGGGRGGREGALDVPREARVTLADFFSPSLGVNVT